MFFNVAASYSFRRFLFEHFLFWIYSCSSPFAAWLLCVLFVQFVRMSMWYYYQCFYVCSSGCRLFIPVRLVILSGWCVYILWAFSVTNPAFITWLGVCALMYAIVNIFSSVQEAKCTLPHPTCCCRSIPVGSKQMNIQHSKVTAVQCILKTSKHSCWSVSGRGYHAKHNSLCQLFSVFTPICSFSLWCGISL